MRAIAAFCALVMIVLSLPVSNVQAQELASWREGANRKAIIDFVNQVTDAKSSDYIWPEDRVAVFDNDGTLWAEQPMYFQLAFVLDRIKELAPQHPEWKAREPFKSVLSGDIQAALASDEKAINEMIVATHSGMTTDEFKHTVEVWISEAKHPKTGKPYIHMVYQPMLELLTYLRTKGFKTYIVSGGGTEFMRPWVESVYGIQPEQVVGSRGKLKYEIQNGQPVLVKLPDMELINDGPGKPIGIQQLIGKRPVMAFGNSDGDLQMLEWTASGVGPRFCLLVHHTDAEREWAYDRASKIGKLDKALDEAIKRHWSVVDMKTDWTTVFPSF